MLIGGAMFLAAATAGPAGAMVASLTPAALHGTAFAILTLANNSFGLAPGPIVTGWLADRIGLLGALQWLPVASIAAALVFFAARAGSQADFTTRRPPHEAFPHCKALAALRGVGPGAIRRPFVIAGAAGFVGDLDYGPVMLFALLLGMAMNFLGRIDRFEAGITFTSKFILRLGVAMLGLKITLGDVASLGWGPLALVFAGRVTLTILISVRQPK